MHKIVKNNNLLAACWQIPKKFGFLNLVQRFKSYSMLKIPLFVLME